MKQKTSEFLLKMTNHFIIYFFVILTAFIVGKAG